MDPDATHTIVTQGGLFGALFVFVTLPLGLFALRLYNRGVTEQNERVNDAKGVTTVLLNSTKEFSETLLEAGQAQRPVDQQIISKLDSLAMKLNGVAETLERIESRPRR